MWIRKVFLPFALFILFSAPVMGQGIFMRDKAVLLDRQTGSKHSFAVEIALSSEQLQNGLMHRTQMDANAGMLFWFGGQERERSFWMKNTLIPLDILFIKKDGTIHHIHENARPMDETPVPSQGEVAAVLEINAGRAQALGIDPGDVVLQRFFSK